MQFYFSLIGQTRFCNNKHAHEKKMQKEPVLKSRSRS